MALEHVLAQRFNESTKWGAKVNTCKCYKTRKFFLRNVWA